MGLLGFTYDTVKFSQALSHSLIIGINDAFRFPNEVLLNKHLKGVSLYGLNPLFKVIESIICFPQQI